MRSCWRWAYQPVARRRMEPPRGPRPPLPRGRLSSVARRRATLILPYAHANEELGERPKREETPNIRRFVKTPWHPGARSAIRDCPRAFRNLFASPEERSTALGFKAALKTTTRAFVRLTKPRRSVSRRAASDEPPQVVRWEAAANSGVRGRLASRSRNTWLGVAGDNCSCGLKMLWASIHRRAFHARRNN